MPITFHQHTLPNGLTIIAEVSPEAHTAAVGYFVKTGARDEDPADMGVSHFLEHMMFKGTARRSADDVNREFDELGANYNAFTSEEMTVYYAQVLPEFLTRATELLGDILRPALREADFDTEKKVILEEIGMYNDRPQWRLHDALLEAHFADHPLSYRVLGTTETVGRLPVESMRRYFHRRYSADNITVAAAGALDFAKLVEDVSAIAGHWEPTGVSRQYQTPATSPQSRTLVDPKLSRHYVAAICPGPSAQDPRRYAAKILADVLGDGDGSRLYWALIDPGLADEVDFSHHPQDHAGSYVAFASCAPERAEEVERTLLETLDAYATSIEADELERAKNKVATAATLHGEIPRGRMHGLGMQWAYLGQYTPLEEELERFMRVTVDDVRALLADMPFSPRTVVRLGPK